MANPRPDLGGFTDREDPQWREKVAQTVDASQRKLAKRAQHRRDWSTQIWADLPFAILLRSAARARGISTAAYIRRATAARIAADLDMPFTEVVAHCAPAGPYDKRTGGAKITRQADDGTGYGEWEIPRGRT